MKSYTVLCYGAKVGEVTAENVEEAKNKMTVDPMFIPFLRFIEQPDNSAERKLFSDMVDSVKETLPTCSEHGALSRWGTDLNNVKRCTSCGRKLSPAKRHVYN